jgi:hypothetical protein
MATSEEKPGTTSGGKPKADPAPKVATAKPEESKAEDTTDDAEQDGPDARLDPYPAYDQMELSELRSLAQERGVGVPADVEKAALVAHLRQLAGEGADVPDESEQPYDLMRVEELRGLVPDGSSALTEAQEKGYLMGQLRAVDSGPTAAQAATQGTGRPATEDVSGVKASVRDKDQGRG